jgi:hypothetical protein
MSNLFIVLYVAIVITPTGKVHKIVEQVPSVSDCLALRGATKNTNFNFIHENCHVVQIPVPDVINKLPPKKEHEDI